VDRIGRILYGIIFTFRISSDVGLAVEVYSDEVEAIGKFDASSSKSYFLVNDLGCLLISVVGSGEGEVVHDIGNA
jgi:hypothetical protein